MVARKLYEKGAFVKLILVEGEPKTNDFIENKRICKNLDLPIFNITEDYLINNLLETADIIVDAIYGTGFHGELTESVRSITKKINQSKAEVYSLDIPSGLNGDTGEADPDTIHANYTIAFHLMKPAHAQRHLAEFCGHTVCLSIGI